jgi:hypothetical protein
MILIVIMTQPASIKLVTTRSLSPGEKKRQLEAREDKPTMQKENFYFLFLEQG